MIKYDRLLLRIKYYYKLIKIKKVDNYLLFIGLFGVVVGLTYSMPLVNKIFAWFILFGVCIKLYDFSEEVERNIIPYDFNKILPPPENKDKK